MKITAMIHEINIQNNGEAHKSSVIESARGRSEWNKEAGRTSSGSDVHITDRAFEFNRIREVINKLPEIREEKIRSINSQIQTGKYSVSAEEIASKLLGEIIIGR